MKVFTYSEARQNLSQLLALAQNEEVEIRRRDGSIFVLRAKQQSPTSPLDVRGVRTKATTSDIVRAVRATRKQ